VSLVALAACNAGNAAFAADFNKRVNARLVDFELDRVTAVSCGGLGGYRLSKEMQR
jgi:hypothetical protein